MLDFSGIALLLPTPTLTHTLQTPTCLGHVYGRFCSHPSLQTLSRPRLNGEIRRTTIPEGSGSLPFRNALNTESTHSQRDTADQRSRRARKFALQERPKAPL